MVLILQFSCAILPDRPSAIFSLSYSIYPSDLQVDFAQPRINCGLVLPSWTSVQRMLTETLMSNTIMNWRNLCLSWVWGMIGESETKQSCLNLTWHDEVKAGSALYSTLTHTTRDVIGWTTTQTHINKMHWLDKTITLFACLFHKILFHHNKPLGFITTKNKKGFNWVMKFLFARLDFQRL